MVAFLAHNFFGRALVALALLLGLTLAGHGAVRPVHAAGTPTDHFTSISTGGDPLMACGLESGGQAVCWGDNDVFQTPYGAPAGRYKSLSLGSDAACGILRSGRAGRVRCWSSSDPPLAPQRRVPVPGGRFVQVNAAGSASWGTFCGLRPNRNITCWWFSSTFGCGVHKPPDCNQFHSAVHAGNFVHVATGSDVDCGLKRDGGVTCWLNSFYGSGCCGETEVPPGRYRQVVVGGGWVCGLRTDRTVTCWGRPRLNQGQTDAPTGRFRSLSTSTDGWATCGVSVSGTVDCWGGVYARGGRPPSGTFRQVSGGQYACGLRPSGVPTCWNSIDPYDGRVIPSFTPGRPFVEAFDDGTGCGLRAGGRAVCLEAPTPRLRFKSVGAGVDGLGYDCGIRLGGRIICWSTGYYTRDAPVPPRGTFTQLVFGGAGGGCAVRTNGHLACWDAGLPPPPDGRFVQVATVGWSQPRHPEFACAVRASGPIACWGGDAYTQEYTIPDRVPGHFTQVSGDAYGDVCALSRGGAMRCWGPGGSILPVAHGSFVQLSLNCGITKSHIVICGGGGRWPGYASIDGAGGGGACGVRVNGTLECGSRTVAGVILPAAGNP